MPTSGGSSLTRTKIDLPKAAFVKFPIVSSRRDERLADAELSLEALEALAVARARLRELWKGQVVVQRVPRKESQSLSHVDDTQEGDGR